MLDKDNYYTITKTIEEFLNNKSLDLFLRNEDLSLEFIYNLYDNSGFMGGFIRKNREEPYSYGEVKRIELLIGDKIKPLFATKIDNKMYILKRIMD